MERFQAIDNGSSRRGRLGQERPKVQMLHERATSLGVLTVPVEKVGDLLNDRFECFLRRRRKRTADTQSCHEILAYSRFKAMRVVQRTQSCHDGFRTFGASTDYSRGTERLGE